jgi:hypothetical protein
MRLVPLCTATLSAAVITACGGDGGPPPSPVRLAITAPSDLEVVHEGRVDVAGTVRPTTATVTVEGRRATVGDGGTFRATVSLEAGTNVVDVLASAGRARPALTAIRVRRQVTVRVPDLVGLSVDDARKQLGAAGLKADVQRDDSLFDRLLPGDPNVCSADPDAGSQVDPGTTIHLVASKQC